MASLDSEHRLSVNAEGGYVSATSSLTHLWRGWPALSGETLCTRQPNLRSIPTERHRLRLVHAYLGGMLRFRRLAELLPSDQPVYGIHVPCTEEQAGNVPAVSVFAREALDRIRAIQPVGRVTVAGHSAGELIALEVARCLLGLSEPDPRVLLIDTVRTGGSASYYWAELLLNAPELIDVPPGSLSWARGRPGFAGANTGILPRMRICWGWSKGTKSLLILSFGVTGHGLRGAITVMRTRQGRIMAFGRSDLGWSSVVSGELKQVYIPGGHISAFESPHVQSMAQKVREWLSAV